MMNVNLYLVEVFVKLKQKKELYQIDVLKIYLNT